MNRTRIHFLGTGNAFHADGRGSPCVLVHPGESSPFLVDAGPTVMAALNREGTRTRDLDRLFVTHLHGDHIAGWPFILLNLALADGRSRPFEVIGPPGLRQTFEELTRLCYGALLEAPGLGFPLRYLEVPVAARVHDDVGGIRVETIPMQHHPSSIGWVFDVEGGRIGVSGDTGWCGGVEALGRCSDLLILEATTVEPGPPAHLSLDQIRSRRDRLGAGRIFLVHLTDAVAASLAADPIVGVTACYDGMIVELD